MVGERISIVTDVCFVEDYMCGGSAQVMAMRMPVQTERGVEARGRKLQGDFDCRGGRHSRPFFFLEKYLTQEGENVSRMTTTVMYVPIYTEW